MAADAERMPPKSPIHEFELPPEIRDDPRIHDIPPVPAPVWPPKPPLPKEVRVEYLEYLASQQPSADAE